MASTDIGDKAVCVTGGSGVIGAWLVRLLLDRGYTVHATVKNLHDENETNHLQALEEYKSQRLRLFQIDLLDYDSIVKAITGVTGVFHLASPCTVDKIHDPEARNNVVWNQKKSEARFVVFSTREYLAEWKNARGLSTKSLYQDIENGDGAISWVRPKNGEVKVSVDAAIFSEHSKYGVGFLARDDKGEVRQGGSKLFAGVVRPVYTEAIAVKEALSWVKEKGWRRIVIESDCLTVVQAIRSNVTLSSPFGQVIRECRMMLQDLNIALFFVK